MTMQGNEGKPQGRSWEWEELEGGGETEGGDWVGVGGGSTFMTFL